MPVAGHAVGHRAHRQRFDRTQKGRVMAASANGGRFPVQPLSMKRGNLGRNVAQRIADGSDRQAHYLDDDAGDDQRDDGSWNDGVCRVVGQFVFISPGAKCRQTMTMMTQRCHGNSDRIVIGSYADSAIGMEHAGEEIAGILGTPAQKILQLGKTDQAMALVKPDDHRHRDENVSAFQVETTIEEQDPGHGHRNDEVGKSVTPTMP